MKIEYQIILIILIHNFADFFLQSRDMALNKSKSNYWLSLHVFYYTIGIIPIALMLWYFNGYNLWYVSLYWLLLNSELHWITDYITSRWTSRLYKEEKFYGFPSFFTAISIDQCIHYTTLILTYNLFKI